METFAVLLGDEERQQRSAPLRWRLSHSLDRSLVLANTATQPWGPRDAGGLGLAVQPAQEW